MLVAHTWVVGGQGSVQSCEHRLISSCSKLLIVEKRKRSRGSINPKFDKLRLLHECLQQAGTYASSARALYALMYSGVLSLVKLEPGELLFRAGSSRHAIHFLLMGHVVGVTYRRMKIDYRDEGFSRPQGHFQ